MSNTKRHLEEKTEQVLEMLGTNARNWEVYENVFETIINLPFSTTAREIAKLFAGEDIEDLFDAEEIAELFNANQLALR